MSTTETTMPLDDHDDFQVSKRVLTPEEVAARRRRSIVIAVSLAAFVVLVFVVTLVRLGGNVIQQPL
jgi:hypothetical protein